MVQQHIPLRLQVCAPVLCVCICICYLSMSRSARHGTYHKDRMHACVIVETATGTVVLAQKNDRLFALSPSLSTTQPDPILRLVEYEYVL